MVGSSRPNIVTTEDDKKTTSYLRVGTEDLVRDEIRDHLPWEEEGHQTLVASFSLCPCRKL